MIHVRRVPGSAYAGENPACHNRDEVQYPFDEFAAAHPGPWEWHRPEDCPNATSGTAGGAP